jgi:hypothetical protein
MNEAKAIRLQLAADAVGDLADSVEELARQLDRLREGVDEETWGRIHDAFPLEYSIGPTTNRGLVKLMHQLTPTEYSHE